MTFEPKIYQAVWLCLHMGYETDADPVQVNGIFVTEDEAIAACRLQNDVIGPVRIGEILPDDGVWPGAYFPLSEDSRWRKGGLMVRPLED